MPQDKTEIVELLKQYFPVDWKIEAKGGLVRASATSRRKMFNLEALGTFNQDGESWLVRITMPHLILAITKNQIGVSLEDALEEARSQWSRYLAEGGELIASTLPIES